MNITTIRFLLALKNASMNNKEQVFLEYNKSYLSVLNVLYSEGLIQSFKIHIYKTKFGYSKMIVITLRYVFDKALLKSLSIISSPSKTVFLTLQQLYKISDKRFVLYLSTNKGIFNLIDCKKYRLGGKVLFSC